MVLIICQDFLILYGTVDKWQHNKSPFLLLSRMWANFFLKHYHFPPSSAWHKSLKANVMEKEQQILSRITHIIVYDMWVYVWRMWAYYLQQIPPKRNKTLFHPYEAKQYGITYIAATLLLWYLYLSFVKICISCSLPLGVCYQVSRDKRTVLLVLCLLPTPNKLVVHYTM